MPSYTKYGELKVALGIPMPLKVQDDDDGLWRWLRTRTIGGTPSLYLAEPGDSIPGTVARVQDDDDGIWRTVKSRTIGGTPSIYLYTP